MVKKPILKIAFVGAACVGKTTLLNKLKDKLNTDKNVAFIEEAARIFFENNEVKVEDVFTFPIQKKIQSIVVKKEKEVHATNPRIIICDRSVLDSPVHMHAHGEIEHAQKLLDHVRSWLPSYTLFLLLNPTGVPYKNDDIRRESDETRQHIHASFVDFFETKNIPYELISGSFEERLARVEEILNK